MNSRFSTSLYRQSYKLAAGLKLIGLILSSQAVNLMDRGVQMIPCSSAWMRFPTSMRTDRKIMERMVSAVPCILTMI